MQAMQKVSPHMQNIREKYKDDPKKNANGDDEAL